MTLHKRNHEWGEMLLGASSTQEGKANCKHQKKGKLQVNTGRKLNDKAKHRLGL